MTTPLPEFTVTTHDTDELTGEAAGTLVMVGTPQGTVTFDTGADGLTHITFTGITHLLDGDVLILEA